MSLNFDFHGVDCGQVGKLLTVLAEYDVEECEIEQGESRVSVRRGARADASSAARALEPATPLQQDASDPITLEAQVVGVFYRSEKRAGPPRVEVGSVVKAGDILGYIEVMRIPHSVTSTHDGTVESFLTDDGEAVEYGQPLVSIQPSAVIG